VPRAPRAGTRSGEPDEPDRPRGADPKLRRRKRRVGGLSRHTRHGRRRGIPLPLEVRPGGWGTLDGEDDDPSVARAAQNGLRQARAVARLMRLSNATGRPVAITPRLIRGLHRMAMVGLSEHAGAFRPDGEFEPLGMHVPPPSSEVPGLVEHMCNVIATAWDESAPIALSAFVLWRLNWIHPFDDGNGRTA